MLWGNTVHSTEIDNDDSVFAFSIDHILEAVSSPLSLPLSSLIMPGSFT